MVALPYKAESNRKLTVIGETKSAKDEVAASDNEDIVTNMNNNLYVKHIPEEWTEDDLRREFEPFGLIKSLLLKKN